MMLDRRPLTRRSIGTAHLRIPRRENPTRIVPAHPDVHTPNPELGYSAEPLTQQRWRIRRRRNIREWDDVLHPDEPEFPVLLRLVEQQLGLEQIDHALVL